MELIQYLRLFRKWAWLILLAAFLAGGISFIVRTGQPSIYEAQTTISIGRYMEAPNPNSSDIRTGMDLAQTYAELVTTFDVLQGTIDVLQLPLTADDLKRAIDTRILTGTSLLIISVKYTDPVLTADIANSLAEQLIGHSPTNLTEEQQRQIDLLNSQITALTSQLGDTRAELDSVSQELEAATAFSDTQRLLTQRNILIDQINAAASTIAEFSSTVVSLQERTNALDIVERARIPSSPSGTTTLNTILLGALVGAMLAGGAVLMIEYMDDRIRSSEQASQLLNLPVLGAIVRFGKKTDRYPERLITHPNVPSAVMESYRTLRTNLLFMAEKDTKSVLIVTSPGPVEGKSVTISNLAVSLAQTGMGVVLIDADLRRPKIHEIFGLDNSVGLTNLLLTEPSKLKVMSTGADDDARIRQMNELKQVFQHTPIPNLRVITSGFIPSNPAEALGSPQMKWWLQVLLDLPTTNVILIDTP